MVWIFFFQKWLMELNHLLNRGFCVFGLSPSLLAQTWNTLGIWRLGAGTSVLSSWPLSSITNVLLQLPLICIAVIYYLLSCLRHIELWRPWYSILDKGEITSYFACNTQMKRLMKWNNEWILKKHVNFSSQICSSPWGICQMCQALCWVFYWKFSLGCLYCKSALVDCLFRCTLNSWKQNIIFFLIL